MSSVKKIKKILDTKLPEDITSEEYKEAESKQWNDLIKIISKSSPEDIRECLGKTMIHCLSNQKGGCSKTTTTSDLGYVLSQKGFKVLLIDTDSQASLSQLCQVFPETFTTDDEPIFGLHDVYEYIVECMNDREPIRWENIKPAIMRPKWRRVNKESFKLDPTNPKYDYFDFGFDLIPTDTGLANYEQILPKQTWSGGSIMKILTDVIKENADYDYIIIDAPPALTTLAYAGIIASEDGILVPINLEVMTLRGTTNIVEAVANVQEASWKISKGKTIHKGILGLIKTQYVKSYSLQKSLGEVVKEFSPIRTFDTAIPRMASCDKAHSEGKLFSQYDKKAFAVFSDLADEIVARDLLRLTEKEPVIIDTIGQDVETTIRSV